ncbi:MAG: class I SAM-dependent methyltransferase [Anaerolineae bacterium]
MDTVKTRAYQTTNLSKYQCDHPFVIERVGDFFDSLIELVALVEPSYVLDIGCGEGFDIKNVCERGEISLAHCCGLDMNLRALKMAQELLIAFPFDAIQGDIHHLPLKLDRFDIILCLEVLEHLECPEGVLREISRHYSGYCVFSVPNEPLYRLTRLLLFGRNIRQLGDHPEHVNHWSRSGFVRLIGKHFVIDRVVTPFPWTIVLCRRREVTR